MEVDTIINMIKEDKMNYVRYQNYEMATALRDMERNLTESRNIFKFVKYVKGQSYYSDVQQYITPLDLIFQRKSKLEKLEKLC